MATFYTSDTHFNHVNIIRPDYCKGRAERYTSIEAMNEDLISRWNARVMPGDTVWHLGDFAMGKFEDAGPIFKRLNGAEKHLILGNHDRTATQMRAMGWTSVAKGATHKAPDGTVLHLAHHPQTYERLDQMRVDLQLCGHVHEAWIRGVAETATSMTPPYRDFVRHWGRDDAGHRGRLINVGIDVRDFEPKTLEELLLAPG